MCSLSQSNHTHRKVKILLLLKTAFAVFGRNVENSKNVFVSKSRMYSTGNDLSSPVEGNISNKTIVMDIYENESYQQGQWYGDTKSRWTDSTGSSSDPPTSLEPPEGYVFDSDWKIDVTGRISGNQYYEKFRQAMNAPRTKDEDGWEYFFGGHRKRRWLRTLAPIQKIPTQERTGKRRMLNFYNRMSSRMSSRKKKKKLDRSVENEVVKENENYEAKARTSSISQLKGRSKFALQPLSMLERLSSNYNFKGFGLSMYKSIVFPTSFGALVRLPISTNFDAWERRPHLPSLSTSTGFFGSHDNWTVVAYLSMSFPMELLRYGIIKVLRILYLIYYVLWCKVIRGLIKASTLLCLQIWGVVFAPGKTNEEAEIGNESIRNSTDVSSTNAIISSIFSSPSIQYSSNYQNRVGVSFSWRVSKLKGYEFRVSYNHLYLPTLDYLFLRRMPDSDMSQWLREKTGGLGLSTGYPLPDPPNFSSSVVLSLNGFFFMRNGIDTLWKRIKFGDETENIELKSEKETESAKMYKVSSSSINMSNIQETKERDDLIHFSDDVDSGEFDGRTRDKRISHSVEL